MTLALNEHWYDAAAKAARKAVPNQAYKSIAVGMACSTPRAADYVMQAPVLALAAAFGRRDHGPLARSFIVGTFAERCKRGPKLRDLMLEYHVAFPLRALRSTAICPSNAVAILTLSASDIHPSALAQAIPAKTGHQHKWLRAVSSWGIRMGLRNRACREGIVWAAVAAGASIARDGFAALDDVADFYIADPNGFNPKWTLDQAKAATDRWHRALGKEKGEVAFFQRFGLGFSEQISYAPLPLETSVGPYRIVALDSGIELFLEGRAMHHCVGTYSADVVRGDARIFSIRQGDRRLATLDLRLSPFGARGHYMIAQLKGPCNSEPAPVVHHAAFAFLKQVNEDLREKEAA